MYHYVVNLSQFDHDTVEKIIQNIRFWCLSFQQRDNTQVYDITSTYEFTPEFMESKGIPSSVLVK